MNFCPREFNAELSRAAAALLVKSVRVGVGLGDLLCVTLSRYMK